MNVSDWLVSAKTELERVGITTARLDCLVLLEDALAVGRAQLLAHTDMEIPVDTQNVLNGFIKRRAGHEPLAYIRGKAEFYGREFTVGPGVLVPRPESEAMIELLLANQKVLEAVQDSGKVRLADVGTGSGALGITAQLELPGVVVELLEIDSVAIEIAKMNVIKFTASTPVLFTDLLVGSNQNYQVLLCNLPYVPDSYEINLAARHEPVLALFAGSDGLDVYRRLFKQIQAIQAKPLLILTESLPSQHTALATLAKAIGYSQTDQHDFIQAFTPTTM